MAKAEIGKVWISEEYAESTLGKELTQMLIKKNIAMETTSKKSIQRVCDSQSSQGVIALMALQGNEELQDIPRYSLYLDDIADPGNMGTLLRTAAWFGIDSVFLSDGCVDPLNSKVLRSAMGAHFYLKNIITISPENLFNKYANSDYAILGSDMMGKSLKDLQIDLNTGWILILSNEAHGISDLLRSYITHNISIPGFGDMESLNVSVAGGILLYNLTN